MTARSALRKEKQDAFTKANGMKLGFMSFFIKATVEALQAVPAINARIEGDDFIQNHFYDIGVAVGTERGLVVPVVRDADKKSFAILSARLASTPSRRAKEKSRSRICRAGRSPFRMAAFTARSSAPRS
jgi:2-oxoglutarate dehydrogenase E2 component (dihydrolipoamide succinyltransferase)